MMKLFKLKEWLTIPEAAKHLSNLFGEAVGDSDILRLALDGQLSLSIYFANKQEGKRATIRTVNASDIFPDVSDTENVMLDLTDDEELLQIQADEIIALEGLFDIPMIFGSRQEVERRYHESIGSKVAGSFGEIIVKRNEAIFEMQSRHRDPLFLQLDDGEDINVQNVLRKSAIQHYSASCRFPDDSLLVVKTSVLREFEASVIGGAENKKKPQLAVSDNTLVATIAALLASFPNGKLPSGKDLEKAAASVGVSISDDSIRKALRAAMEMAPSLKPA